MPGALSSERSGGTCQWVHSVTASTRPAHGGAGDSRWETRVRADPAFFGLGRWPRRRSAPAAAQRRCRRRMRHGRCLPPPSASYSPSSETAPPTARTRAGPSGRAVPAGSRRSIAAAAGRRGGALDRGGCGGRRPVEVRAGRVPPRRQERQSTPRKAVLGDLGSLGVLALGLSISAGPRAGMNLRRRRSSHGHAPTWRHRHPAGARRSRTTPAGINVPWPLRLRRRPVERAARRPRRRTPARASR